MKMLKYTLFSHRKWLMSYAASVTKRYNSADIRNIGILAHIDAGTETW